MRQREWKIEWRAVPKADGNDRLSRAMRLVLERAIEAEHRRETTATATAAAKEVDSQSEEAR